MVHFEPILQYYFNTGANPQVTNSPWIGFRTTFSP
jgi:hypothetical protein